MLVVIALGGNALLQRGDAPTAQLQKNHAKKAAQAIARLASSHEILLCHGNGPQVGLLALNSPDTPFDVLVAETQGMIGYFLQQALQNAGLNKPVMTLLTQTVVDGEDTAFANPTKPIGPLYDAPDQLIAQGLPFKSQGTKFRRVIASPAPKRIVEINTIKTLLAQQHLVICNGGGGIPVIEKNGGLCGTEAVIDKDLSSSLLATQLCADRFIILTDVECVYRDFGTPQQQAIRQATLADMRHISFEAGSMGPKVRAACDFVAATGNKASIGNLFQLDAILQETAGTHVVK